MGAGAGCKKLPVFKKEGCFHFHTKTFKQDKTYQRMGSITDVYSPSLIFRIQLSYHTYDAPYTGTCNYITITTHSGTQDQLQIPYQYFLINQT